MKRMKETIHDLDANKLLSNDNKTKYGPKFSDKQSICKLRYQFNKKGLII